ncbi:MAG TPA: BPSL0067 family protein [Rhodocyclaceae bacterium]|nr:BPSL0067 family protein [Rhodocyclaceae bacterium]
MPHILSNPSIYKSRSFANASGNTECVEFIRQTLNAPPTANWRAGTQISRLAGGVKDPVASGTAIATFVGGSYPQHGSTGKYAAIYINQNTEGIQVLDQWRAQGQVLPRTIPWKPRRAGLSNDGNAFSVIEW